MARDAKLTGATESDTQPLRLEVLRLEEAGETPLALVAALESQTVDPAQNAAELLSAALSDVTRLELFSPLEAMMPDGQGERFAVGSEDVEAARQLLDKIRPLRDQIATAGAAPECRFDVRFDLGFYDKLRYVDDVAIASRVHLLECKPLLAEGDVAAALDKLDAAMLWTDRLTQVGRLDCRMRAAKLRRECLSVAEAIASLRSVQQADIERLFSLIRRTLVDWPPVADALVGERALVLHSYEAVRDGRLDQIVTNDERNGFREGLLEKMQSLSKPEIDRDELAYLRGMRELITASETPHYQAVRVIDETLGDLDPDGPGAEAAPLASNLFITGVGYGMLELARDRALVEAWSLLLAAAGELGMPPYKTNPATGAEYELLRDDGLLTIVTGDSDLPNPSARTPR